MYWASSQLQYGRERVLLQPLPLYGLALPYDLRDGSVRTQGQKTFSDGRQVEAYPCPRVV